MLRAAAKAAVVVAAVAGNNPNRSEEGRPGAGPFSLYPRRIKLPLAALQKSGERGKGNI